MFHRVYYYFTSGDIGRSIYRWNIEKNYTMVVDLVQATINTQNLTSGSDITARKVAQVAVDKAISNKIAAKQSAEIAAQQNARNNK